MESHVPKRQERVILRDGRRHGETLEKGDRLSVYNSLRGHACCWLSRLLTVQTFKVRRNIFRLTFYNRVFLTATLGR